MRVQIQVFQILIKTTQNMENRIIPAKQVKARLKEELGWRTMEDEQLINKDDLEELINEISFEVRRPIIGRFKLRDLRDILGWIISLLFILMEVLIINKYLL